LEINFERVNELHVNEKYLSARDCGLHRKKNLGEKALSLVSIFRVPPPRYYARTLCNQHLRAIEARRGERRQIGQNRKTGDMASQRCNDCARARTRAKN